MFLNQGFGLSDRLFIRLPPGSARTDVGVEMNAEKIKAPWCGACFFPCTMDMQKQGWHFFQLSQDQLHQAGKKGIEVILVSVNQRKIVAAQNNLFPHLVCALKKGRL